MKKTYRAIATLAMGALLLPVVALSGVNATHADVSSTSIVGAGGVQGGVQGVHSVYLPGAVGQKYLKNKPALGAPRAAEVCQGLMCWQEFNGGDIYWSGLTGATMVLKGEIRTRYEKLGAQFSGLGLPSGDKRKGLREGGQWQQFQKGGIFDHSKFGAHPVKNGMWTAWSRLSRENGQLGFPAGSEYAVKGGAAQKFQKGTLYWNASNGASTTILNGGIKTKYDSLGAEKSSLGLPVSTLATISSGMYQEFQNSYIVWSPGIGAKVVGKNTFNVWRTQLGVYGWPTKDTWADSKGSHTKFQKMELVVARGIISSGGTAGPKTAVLICDSQCEGNSWIEQGVKANGYTQIVEKGYGGGGFAAPAMGTLNTSITTALHQNRINMPQGNPGLVVLTLGGNDASQGYSDAQILTQMRSAIARVKVIYPRSKIVVNGVMSSKNADHARRRAVDKLVTNEAARQGISNISVAGWGTTLKPGMRDKVHLNQAGHNKVAPTYEKALRKVRTGK